MVAFTTLPLEIDFETSTLLEYKAGFNIFLETPVLETQFSDFATAITEVWSSVMTDCEWYWCLHSIKTE